MTEEFSQLALIDEAPKNLPREGGYIAKKAMECGEQIVKPYLFTDDFKTPPSEFFKHILKHGVEFEDMVFASLSSEGKGVVILEEVLDEDGNRTPEGKDQLERDTFNALIDPEVFVICGGRLGSVFESLWAEHTGVDRFDEARISQPDIMLVYRDEEFPKVVAVDVKDHAAASKGSRIWETSQFSDLFTVSSTVKGLLKIKDWMQIAHYYRHFQTLGLDYAPRGAIVGRELVAVWADLVDLPFTDKGTKSVLLDMYDKYFARARSLRVQTIDYIKGGTPPDSLPVLIPACSDCEWRTLCADELAAAEDISLLPGMTQALGEEYRSRGIDSIRTLARVPLAKATASSAGEDPEFPEKLKLRKFVLQARTYAAQRVARADDVDVVDLYRADVEVDFDLENSSNPLEGSDHTGPLVYLWGVRETIQSVDEDGIVKVKVRTRQFSDFTDTEEGEARVFAEFWKFIAASKKKADRSGLSWRAYHYTNHEVTWCVKLAEKHAGYAGVPTPEEVRCMLTNFTDLHEVLTSQLVWPTKNHTIKTLAKWSRFSWRTTEAAGDNSILWYTQSVTASGKEKSAARKRLLNYNEDDVKAQYHLREWVSNLTSAEEVDSRLPKAEDLRKPVARRR